MNCTAAAAQVALPPTCDVKVPTGCCATCSSPPGRRGSPHSPPGVRYGQYCSVCRAPARRRGHRDELNLTDVSVVTGEGTLACDEYNKCRAPLPINNALRLISTLQAGFFQGCMQGNRAPAHTHSRKLASMRATLAGPPCWALTMVSVVGVMTNYRHPAQPGHIVLAEEGRPVARQHSQEARADLTSKMVFHSLRTHRRPHAWWHLHRQRLGSYSLV
jgi:hypothetical protein